MGIEGREEEVRNGEQKGRREGKGGEVERKGGWGK